MGQFTTQIMAAVSLVLSLVTAYFTLFRRGTIRMTQPTVIFFGPDGGPTEFGRSSNKIFLRMLLYSTSKSGRIVECMFVRIRRGESVQNFNIWVYGDNSVVRGSGLFVGESGVASNHHFLLPRDAEAYQFRAGDYELEVIATLVGSSRQIKLHETRLTLPDHLASQLVNSRAGVYFDWGPDSQNYHPHIDTKPEPKLPSEIMESLVALSAPSPSNPETVKKQRAAKNRSNVSSEAKST